MSISKGAIVTLKSGGPKMTAGDQVHGDYYHRIFYWFTQDQLQVAQLDDDCVVVVPGTEKEEA
jgi:uncharacterized protein YodC (DUF2158 family)